MSKLRSKPVDFVHISHSSFGVILRKMLEVPRGTHVSGCLEAPNEQETHPKNSEDYWTTELGHGTTPDGCKGDSKKLIEKAIN